MHAYNLSSIVMQVALLDCVLLLLLLLLMNVIIYLTFVDKYKYGI